MPASSADILQEYLVKLGFQTDAISLKKFDSTLGVVGKKVLGVGVAVAGMAIAAERGVAAFAEAMEGLHYSSKLTGTSVAKLQSLRFAAEQIGVSGDTAAASVQNLATALKLKPGTVSILESFGISTEGREGADITLDLLKRLKQEAPMIGAMWAEQLLGMDQETFLLTMANLDQLAEKYAAHQQTIRNTGTDMDAAAETLKNYNNQLRTTEANLDKLGIALATNLAPTFTALNKQLNITLDFWTKFLGGDVETWDAAKQYFTDIPSAANKAVKATAGFFNPWGHWDDYAKPPGTSTQPGSNVSSGKIKRLSTAPIAPIAPTQKAGSIISTLQGHGWTKEQATGIVANLERESSLNPSAVGDSGKAYGVAQWHPTRQEDFAKFAGKDIRHSTLEEQLAFLTHELRSGKETKAGGLLSSATSAEEAARLFSMHYERPAGGMQEANIRAMMATRLGAENAGNRPPLTVNQQTTINVAGSGAESTAKAVVRGQNEVNSRIVRDMVGRQAG